jgi:hypothetical protein
VLQMIYKYAAYSAIALLVLLGIQTHRLKTCQLADVTKELSETKTENKVMEKRNEIRNNRPGRSELVSRMRNGTF